MKKDCNNKICKVYYSCVPGPRGPAGSNFNTYLMAHNITTQTLTADQMIPFDMIDINSNIQITPQGIITIPTKGIYKIDFWINVAGVAGDPKTLSVTLQSITPTEKILATATTGEVIYIGGKEVISGIAIIEATNNETLKIVTDQAMDISAVNGYSGFLTIHRIN